MAFNRESPAIMFGRLSSAAARSHNTLIRNVTEIDITIGAGASSGTQAISVTTLENTFWIPGGSDVAAGGTNSRSGWQPRVSWTSSVFTAATADTSSGVARRVTGILVEFMPFVIEKWYMDTITIAANGGVQNTVSPPGTWDLTRTVPCWLGCTTTHAGQSTGQSLASVEITSAAPTLAAKRAANSVTESCTVGVLMVQFARGILQDESGKDGYVGQSRIIIPVNNDDWSEYHKTIPFDSGSLLYQLPISLGLNEILPVFSGWNQTGFQTGTPYATADALSGYAARGAALPSDTAEVSVHSVPFGARWIYLASCFDMRIASGSATENLIGGGLGLADLFGLYTNGIDSSLRDWSERVVWGWMGNSTDNTAANIDRFPARLGLDVNTDLVAARGASAATYVDVGVFYVMFH